MELFTALILGLIGSLHCAGMCGPLALAVPASARSRAAWLRSRAAYNLGRVLTYILLGLLFGLLGKTLVLAGLQRFLSIGLGLGVLVAVFASKKAALGTPATLVVAKLKAGMSDFLRQNSLFSQAGLGVLNGLLPCGLVYVAAAAAAATGSIAHAGLYMAAFGLGTLPMMLAIGLGWRLVSPALRLKLLRVMPYSVFLVGTILILRGLGLGIPFISPDLAAGSCCLK